jgi:hypothetical protein
MKPKSPSQLKAEEVRNRHLARQFPHVGQIIAEHAAYKAALEAAGIPLPLATRKDVTKPKVKAAPAAPVEPVSEPLPTEPTAEQTEAPAAPVESADESAASDWAQPAAPKKTARRK